MGKKSFENPLLSHARMRGLYRGLVEARSLRLASRGSEACFVAACIGLREGDFALSGVSRTALDYLRAVGARAGNGAPRAAGARRMMDAAEDGFAGSPQEGLLCAAGAAMSLKAGGGDAVAMALFGGKGSEQAAWARGLRMTAAAELPLILVALPDRSGMDWAAAGKRAGVPVIPVDASDAVALYRVAQESIGRARADRRGAVIECVASGADPVRRMGEQLVAKGIADERWARSVAGGFKALLEANALSFTRKKAPPKGA